MGLVQMVSATSTPWHFLLLAQTMSWAGYILTAVRVCICYLLGCWVARPEVLRRAWMQFITRPTPFGVPQGVPPRKRQEKIQPSTRRTPQHPRPAAPHVQVL